MREASFWIISRDVIFSRGNSFGKLLFINLLPISLFSSFTFVISEDTLRVVTFSDIENQNTGVFKMWRLEKHLKNMSSDVRCVFKEGGQGCRNLGKSSFAFKGNAMKRSEFHVYFLFLDFTIFCFIVSFDENWFWCTNPTRITIPSTTPNRDAVSSRYSI